MPRYFFDVHDGELSRDDEGQECASLDDARHEAMLALPEIAKDKIPMNGDRQAYMLLVRDETERVVYTATLTFSGASTCSD